MRMFVDSLCTSPKKPVSQPPYNSYDTGMPVLAPLMVVVAFAVLIQGMTADIPSKIDQLAAGAVGDLNSLGINPTGAAKSTSNYDTTAADKQCPKETETSKYRHDKPMDKPFVENKKTIQNLYGKPCKSDFVDAKCSSANVCNGGLEGAKCFGSSGWKKCEATHPSVRALQTTQSAQLGGTQVPGGSAAPTENQLAELGKNKTPTTPTTPSNTTGRGINQALTNPQSTPAATTPAAKPSVENQLSNLSGNPVAQPTVPQTNLPQSTRIASMGQQPAFNPTAAQTITPGIQQAPTPAITPGATVPSAQTTFPRAPFTNTGLPTQNNPYTPTPSPSPRSGSSRSGFNNFFSNIFSSGSSFSGITSFVTSFVSSASSQSQQQQPVVQQVVKPIVVLPQKNAGTSQVQTPITPTQNQINPRPIVLIYENPSARPREIGGVPIPDVPEIRISTMESPLSAEFIERIPQNTDRIPERIVSREYIEPPTIFATGVTSTIESMKDAFVEKISVPASTKENAKFSAVPMTPPSTSVVQRFHAISIPDLLDAITQGSFDLIRRVLARGQPENATIVTRRGDTPTSPVVGDRSESFGPEVDASAELANVPGSQARGDNAQTPVVSPRERMEQIIRRDPAEVFREASPAHRTANAPAEVPIVVERRVFGSAVPVPEPPRTQYERPAVFVAFDNAVASIKNVFRSAFSWFN